MIQVQIKLNEKKQVFQVWINGGVNASFDANIFFSQQVWEYAHKLFEKEIKAGELIQFEDLTGNIEACSNCGSHDVERKMWFNLETGRLSSISDDEEDCWCNTCQKHIEIKEEKEGE